MYYVGIDIAKRRHVAAVRDETGREVGSTLSFANDAGGFESLVGWLEGLGAGPGNSVVAMESTAHYWVALYAWLDERGFGQAVVNPILTEAFRSATSVRKTKTDASDAASIAEFARFKGLEPRGAQEDHALQGRARGAAHGAQEPGALHRGQTLPRAAGPVRQEGLGDRAGAAPRVRVRLGHRQD